MAEEKIKQIKQMIEEGECYNAALTCKSLAFRKKKRNFGEATKLLATGCECLLEKGEWVSGCDVGLTLIKTYQEAQVEPTNEIVCWIVRMLSLIPSSSSSSSPSSSSVSTFSILKPFLFTSMNWTASYKQQQQKTTSQQPQAQKQPGGEGGQEERRNGGMKKAVPYPGHPLLLTYLGERERENGNFSDAQDHFIKANRPDLLFDLLEEWEGQEKGGENKDLFVCRATLLFLTFGNLKDANLFFKKYWELLCTKDEPSPLMNFTRFLLLTLGMFSFSLFPLSFFPSPLPEREAHPLFKQLQEIYQPSLQRDPSLTQSLSSISEIYYGVKVGGGGFGDLFSALLR